MKKQRNKHDIAKAVCDTLASSEKSLASILDTTNGAPKVTLWYEWMKEDEELAKMYAYAKEAQADYMAAQIVEIADNEPDANKARIRVDARKWVASKLKPRSYGDKVTLQGDTQNPLAFTVVSGIEHAPGTAISADAVPKLSIESDTQDAEYVEVASGGVK